jgi:hypothetical protein
MIDRSTGLFSNSYKQVRLKNLILWVLLSVLFTTIQINQSLRQSQLAVPITCDDIVYFEDALARLQILYSGGPACLLLNYIESPPNSPISTLIPFIGFAIFGVKDWAPAAANGIIIFLSPLLT